MRRIRALAMVSALALAACQSPTTNATFELRDGSISGPFHVTSDTSMFTATNTGELAHTLVVTTADGTVVAATDLVQPGETVDLKVDLDEGMFQVSCRIVAQTGDGELLDHFELGMHQTVDVVSINS